jgi:HK97 family phage major capsid protein
MGMTKQDLETLIESKLGASMEDIRKEFAKPATDNAAGLDGAATAKKEEAGSRIGRILLALAAAKGDVTRAARFAHEKFHDDVVTKALAAGTDAAGGYVVFDEMAREVIELLRPKSVVRSLGPTTVGLDTGTLLIPKHTAGSTGGWIGENANVPKTQPTFGQLSLTAKKYASLVPISNDLIRRAAVNSQMFVRDDMVADIATGTDLGFLSGSGASNQPTGILNQSGISTFGANATVNLANVTTDLGTMVQTLMDSHVRFIRPGWIIEPRTWRYLITVRDGNGNLPFADEMRAGTIFGFPYRVTTQIPRNGGAGTNETKVLLADFADVVIGEATKLLLDVSDTAAYHDGSNVVASFSLDQTVVRAIIEVDLALRHAESVVVLTAVKWF